MTQCEIDSGYLRKTLETLLSIPSPSGYTDQIARWCGEELGRLGVEYELTRRGEASQEDGRRRRRGGMAGSRRSMTSRSRSRPGNTRLPRVAAPARPMAGSWWCEVGSNHRPPDYESGALTG